MREPSLSTLTDAGPVDKRCTNDKRRLSPNAANTCAANARAAFCGGGKLVLLRTGGKLVLRIGGILVLRIGNVLPRGARTVTCFLSVSGEAIAQPPGCKSIPLGTLTRNP